MNIEVVDDTFFTSSLTVVSICVVLLWAFYTWTFHQFHGGHIIFLDYNTLLKKEFERVKMERWNAANPTI